MTLLFGTILLAFWTFTLPAPCPYTVEKVGWGVENSHIQQKAYEISGCDQNFVHLLDWENGNWTVQRVHYGNGTKVGKDHGLCGINDYYHWEIVSNENFFDTDWQIRKCYELYKGGTRFYGADKGKSSNIVFHER